MALKKCKECGAEVSSDAKTCPKCGKSLKISAGRIILGIILMIIGLGIFSSGINSITNPTNSTTSETASQTNEKFTLVSHSITTDEFGSDYIEGTIQNNTNKEYSYVQVTFTLYDKTGNQLGTAVDNINNLKSNGSWKYKAVLLTTEKVDRYELSEITGW